ncbi:hypothetical protein PHLCEN_2v12795 [Hermanssonia centrifuga]|uniref:Indole-diterpene biosynthesis protein PaxU n=1 Tax=Hermanssonia centrifuga TaxID=98765 RepID=A0A2R6NG26_9APHY|nr:hypothetical protein PHLCEN_2v12795 [Hermanssonia centrifuga]
MSTKLSKDPFPGLTRLGGDVYVSSPPDTSTAGSHDPQVILILGWMNAQAPHLQKYLDNYRTIFPGATLILVRTWGSFWWSGAGSREACLTPAIDALKGSGMFRDTPPSLLVHVFSNGGNYLMVELARILASRGLASQPPSPSQACLVLDSLPGSGELSDALRAFTSGMRSPVMKLLACIPLTFMWVVLTAVRWMSGKSQLLTELQNRLNNPTLLPWFTKDTPRLYLYGDGDEVVRAHSIEGHIAAAKQLGLNVQAELFHGSPHVSHARKDPERYWGAVKSLWEAEWKAQHT